MRFKHKVLVVPLLAVLVGLVALVIAAMQQVHARQAFVTSVHELASQAEMEVMQDGDWLPIGATGSASQSIRKRVSVWGQATTGITERQ
jgi:hypothetical protein